MMYEYTISQINGDLPGAELFVYSNWSEVEKLGGFHRDMYDETAKGIVFAPDDMGSHWACEMLFQDMNSGSINDIRMKHSFSVSDIVTLKYTDREGRKVIEEWFCDSIGFRKLTERVIE